MKSWYQQNGDAVEQRLDGFVIDIIRGERLIEIQTHNFGALKRKLAHFLPQRSVHIVYPVPQLKWIVRLSADEEIVLSRRRSPKKGRVEDIFNELVRIPFVFQSSNFSVEVLLVEAEEWWLDDKKGSWRRKGWSIYDHQLIEVKHAHHFSSAEQLLTLLPPVPEVFTSADVATSGKLKRRLAQRMLYCFKALGLIIEMGKRGRAICYTISASPE